MGRFADGGAGVSGKWLRSDWLLQHQTPTGAQTLRRPGLGPGDTQFKEVFQASITSRDGLLP